MAGEKKIEETREQRKVGVYLCHCGGNISDHVDIGRVFERAKKIPGVVVVRDNTFMCSDPGQELIMEDLRRGTVDRVVVASCAPSLHEATFRSAITRAGANPYLYEHANIREQVSWVHHGEAATDKAARLIAAAAAKARELEPLDPLRVKAVRHATVIGGGIAGLTAARDLAERGTEVALIEKSPFLGGRVARLDRVAPTGEKASDLMAGLVAEVSNHPRVTVYHCTQVVGFEGYIGNFRLSARREPPLSDRSGEFTLETGVVVLATGFKPYRPRTGEYGFCELPEVVTLPEFIELMARNEKAGDFLEIDGKKIKRLAMIHCVGSRQIPGIHEENPEGSLNEYCSRTCCGATLHAANLARSRHPRTHVFDFYRDIRTYGRCQEELYYEASRNKVLFFRFEADSPPLVMKAPEGAAHSLLIRVKDTLSFGEEVEVPADLVVLSTGMEPNDISDLVDLMKLPVGEDRFLLEVHPKLRPVELAVAGILLAGTCQAPMDMGEACAAASGAAVKASALLSRGYVELDPFVAEVDLAKCTGSGACVEACPREGALKLVEVEIGAEKLRRARVTPALCLGCGACVAVCPENAIEVKGWTLKQYEAMVDAIVGEDAAA